MSFVAAAGLGLSAWGAYNNYEQGRDMQSAQNRALASARTTLGGFSGGFNVSGLGPSARMNPEGTGFTLDYDADSQNLARGAGAYANTAFGGMGQGFNPAMLGLGGLDSLFGRNSSVGDANYMDMLSQMRNGFQRPLQNTAFMGAANQLRDASMGGEDARMRTLDLLRSQAAPFESRALDDLQNRQFGMGQLGSSGGALQTEAFARGLGQADLDRQLQAAQEGRNFQNNAMGLAQGMTGMGSGLASQEQDLLNSAFGRFANIQGMNLDLNRERFSRSAYGTMLPFQLDAARLGNISGALGLRSGLQDSALQMFQAGLGGAQAGANARIGSGSNIAGIVGSPNFGMGGLLSAGAIGQVGSAMMGGQSAGDILGRMFTPRTPLDTSQMSGFAGSGINPYTARAVG